MSRDTYGTVTALIRQTVDDRDQAGGVVFTDPDLLSYVNAALLGLGVDLANAGASFMKGEITRNLQPTVDTQIDWSVPVGQTLPDDFVLPLKAWEKATGDPDNTYTEMDDTQERLPDYDPATKLRFWCWTGGAVKFLGATAAVTVRILYERQLPKFAQASDVIPIPSAANTLAYSALKQAAMSRGETELGQYADTLYQTAYNQLKRLYVKGNQRRGRRRIAYGLKRPYRF